MGKKVVEADGQRRCWVLCCCVLKRCCCVLKRCCWVWAALFSECKNSNQDTFEELCNHENGKEILLFLLLSAVIKILLTIITFGNPVPGGVFVPALVIGGLVGRAVGFALQVLNLKP